jgi:hypothetical protein
MVNWIEGSQRWWRWTRKILVWEKLVCKCECAWEENDAGHHCFHKIVWGKLLESMHRGSPGTLTADANKRSQVTQPVKRHKCVIKKLFWCVQFGDLEIFFAYCLPSKDIHVAGRLGCGCGWGPLLLWQKSPDLILPYCTNYCFTQLKSLLKAPL